METVESASPFCIAVDNQGGWDYEESDILNDEAVNQIIQNTPGINSWPVMNDVSYSL